MNSPRIVLPLEQPFAEFPGGPTDVKAVLLAGLSWPTEYWVELALRWVEQGAPVDAEVAAVLQSIPSGPLSQGVRHRARAAANLWKKGNATR